VEALEGRSIAGAEVRDDGLLLLALKDGETFVAGPVLGRDGKDGVDGKDGERGEPGREGKSADPVLVERVERRLEVLEGRALTEALIDRDGGLVLLFGDGSSLPAGKVVGRDGVDGKDGRDGLDGKPGEIGPEGLGFDDLDVALHGDGRTVVLAFMRGETVKRFELALPAMVYRGVYEAGRRYAPGDTVTFGGSSWHCNAPTDAKPGETEKTWTLAVKRGRDGKDFAGPQVKVPS
jgi:integrin beta 3